MRRHASLPTTASGSLSGVGRSLSWVSTAGSCCRCSVSACGAGAAESGRSSGTGAQTVALTGTAAASAAAAARAAATAAAAAGGGRRASSHAGCSRRRGAAVAVGARHCSALKLRHKTQGLQTCGQSARPSSPLPHSLVPYFFCVEECRIRGDGVLHSNHNSPKKWPRRQDGGRKRMRGWRERPGRATSGIKLQCRAPEIGQVLIASCLGSRCSNRQVVGR